MKILYLTCLTRCYNPDEYLAGLQLVQLFQREHELLLANCVVEEEKKAERLAEVPSLEADLLSVPEVEDFGPDVIFFERGIHSGPWRVAEPVLERWLQQGMAVIVEGLDANRARDPELDALWAMTGLRPRGLGEGPQLRRFRDDHSNGGHPQQPLCRPDHIEVNERLRPVWSGIDGVIASLPIPLEGSFWWLATTEPTAYCLSMDLRSDDPPLLSPWAGVHRHGNGLLAVIGASVAHDVFVSKNPDNARFLVRLASFLVDEVGRTSGLHARPGRAARSRAAPDTAALIRGGENEYVEFKDSALIESIMQEEFVVAVAALANARGGTLLIGVRDDGSVCGIQQELRHVGNRDKYRQRLTQLVRDRIDHAATTLVTLQFDETDAGPICRVTVEPAKRPLWARADKKEEALFVRVGAQSQKLPVRAAANYLRERFV